MSTLAERSFDFRVLQLSGNTSYNGNERNEESASGKSGSNGRRGGIKAIKTSKTWYRIKYSSQLVFFFLHYKHVEFSKEKKTAWIPFNWVVNSIQGNLYLECVRFFSISRLKKFAKFFFSTQSCVSGAGNSYFPSNYHGNCGKVRSIRSTIFSRPSKPKLGLRPWSE